MTEDELCRCCSISKEKLNDYDCSGLLDTCSCREEYQDDAVERIALIQSLLNNGLDQETVARYLDTRTDDAVRLRILKKQRCCLLEEIHILQQALDHLDYMIVQIRKESDAEKQRSTD
ncbi:MAG: hypothetical protein ACOYB8_04545 [Eubacteriaceae bacterium]|jgi:DNA-binding transcriptional MerR regulator